MSFKGMLSGLLKTAEAVKNEVVKIADAVPGVMAKLEKDAPEVAAIADAFVPGASTYVNMGLAALEEIAGVIDSGGAAAKTNLLNAGLDQNMVAAIENLIPTLKGIATKK